MNFILNLTACISLSVKFFKTNIVPLLCGTRGLGQIVAPFLKNFVFFNPKCLKGSNSLTLTQIVYPSVTQKYRENYRIYRLAKFVHIVILGCLILIWLIVSVLSNFMYLATFFHNTVDIGVNNDNIRIKQLKISI